MSIKEGGTFETFRDPNGNVLASINRDGSVLAQAIDFGDGTVQTTAAAGGGAVSSVFGRTGAVVAAANDYTAAQLAIGALPNGVTATTQAERDSTTKVATTQFVNSQPPFFRTIFEGNTTNPAPSFVVSVPPNSVGGGQSMIRLSLYKVILAEASESLTVGSISIQYHLPQVGTQVTCTFPAATIDTNSTLSANTVNSTYVKTLTLAMQASTSATVTWNGTIGDIDGTFNSYVSMIAEVASNS